MFAAHRCSKGDDARQVDLGHKEYVIDDAHQSNGDARLLAEHGGKVQQQRQAHPFPVCRARRHGGSMHVGEQREHHEDAAKELGAAHTVADSLGVDGVQCKEHGSNQRNGLGHLGKR